MLCSALLTGHASPPCLHTLPAHSPGIVAMPSLPAVCRGALCVLCCRTVVRTVSGTYDDVCGGGGLAGGLLGLLPTLDLVQVHTRLLRLVLGLLLVHAAVKGQVWGGCWG